RQHCKQLRFRKLKNGLTRERRATCVRGRSADTMALAESIGLSTEYTPTPQRTCQQTIERVLVVKDVIRRSTRIKRRAILFRHSRSVANAVTIRVDVLKVILLDVIRVEIASDKDQRLHRWNQQFFVDKVDGKVDASLS